MSVELATGLGGVALFAAPGWALSGCFPALRRLSPLRRFAYAYPLGVVAVAGSLYALSHLCGVPLRPPAVWTICGLPILAGAAAWVVRKRPPPPASQGKARWGVRRWVRRSGGPLPIACAVLAAAAGLGVVAEAVSSPVTDWDGRMTWCVQARYLRHAGTVDAGVLRDRRWWLSNPRYPLLLPVAQVAVLEAFVADQDSHSFRLLYVAFFPALLLLIYDGARRSAGRSAAATGALLAALIPFFSYGDGGAVSTYSDMPLACFFGGGVLLLLGRTPRGAQAATGIAAGLLLAGAVLAKEEGSLLAIFALLLGGFLGAGRQRSVAQRGEPASPRRQPPVRSLAAAAAAAVPVGLALLLFASWRAGVPSRQDVNYLGLLVDGRWWPGVLTHIGESLPALLHGMYNWQHWSLFWWMAPLLLLAGRRALRRPLHRRLLAAAAGPPLVAVAAYALYSRPVFLAVVSWERFLLQAAVPLLIVLAAALRDVAARRLVPVLTRAPGEARS
ncbi:MAG TPA: glycosyltransferase family 39 protein [Thermoanaerobaculia bacterium]|nr:glycosyltransferase family 39 protein [Thermoanaerobaculia bacterium]